ncbi:MAG: asparagine synthase (glutamine-hydrolyzing), partial [Flavobacteriales bacterium]
MCGIGGVLRLQGVRPDELERMGALMKHRGPDDEGYCLVESDGRFRCFSGDDTVEPRSELDHITQTVSNCSLGMVHRRLSILDTGPAGHQPMVLQGRYVLIYNGEIYNYRELRSDLTSENCSFHSLSDSEVLLNAFAKWGQGALHRFIGMWAFAIYDKQEHKLTLCRDRFGIKPLYFVSRKGFFAFASEIKPLLQLDECSKNARIEACIEYIAFGSNANPDMTLFRDVSEVPPAAFMQIDCKTGKFTTHAYYNLSDMIKNQEGVNTLPFARQLHESVCLHLRSDVPLGSCLSGGLDSSAIVYSASQEIEALNTFTASYPGDEVDEARFASAVATHCGNVKGHCTYPAPADYWQEVGEMLRHQEQPVNSTSP